MSVSAGQLGHEGEVGGDGEAVDGAGEEAAEEASRGLLEDRWLEMAEEGDAEVDWVVRTKQQGSEDEVSNLGKVEDIDKGLTEPDMNNDGCREVGPLQGGGNGRQLGEEESVHTVAEAQEGGGREVGPDEAANQGGGEGAEQGGGEGHITLGHQEYGGDSPVVGLPG